MSVGSALAVLTMVVPRWIELVFGVDPDHGSGVVESAVVVIALLGSATLTLLARYEWCLAARAGG